MKTIAAPLKAVYQDDVSTLAYLLTVTRSDGEVYRFTDTNKPLVVGANTFEPGLDVAAIAQSAGLAVNNLEITIVYDLTFIREDFIAGRWDNARWVLSETNWSDTTDGTNVIGNYVTGIVTPGEVSVVVEMRALSQFLQQPIGIVTSKTCRARFADYPTAVSGAVCGLSSAAYIETGTITNVTSQQIARDSARAEVADYFGEGVLTWTTGDNIGLSQKVKTYDVNGTFTFALPFPFAIQVGDTYSVIAGCRKRRTEDCLTKFDNVLNFQGEPDLPGIDLATASPVVDR